MLGHNRKLITTISYRKTSKLNHVHYLRGYEILSSAVNTKKPQRQHEKNIVNGKAKTWSNSLSLKTHHIAINERKLKYEHMECPHYTTH